MFWGIFIANNFAVNFNIRGDDSHPDFLLNCFLWIGAIAAVLAVLYIMGKFYILDSNKVFWIMGLVGIIIEQNFLVPLQLFSLQIIPAIIISFSLLPVYGITYAFAWTILPNDSLPKGKLNLNILRTIILAIFVSFSFYFGSLSWWILLDELFGIKVI